MDDRRFDELTRALVRTGTRRATLGALAGGALAAGLTRLGLKEAAAACKLPGKQCTKNKQCCGKKCKQGKCRCAKAGQACAKDKECCSSDCVAGRCCEAAGTCCQAPTESCEQISDCCFGGSTRCEAPAGSRRKRCCLREGESCFAFPGACCNGLVCDGGTCVVVGGIYTCKYGGESCHDSDDCCDGLACCDSAVGCCGSVGCNGDHKQCCQLPGGDCVANWDCCFGLGGGAHCEAGPGGRKRCCLPEGEYCNPPGSGCCNGLVCDVGGSNRCVKLGIGT